MSPYVAVPLVSIIGVAVGGIASLVATALVVHYLLRRDPETFLSPTRLGDTEAAPNEAEDRWEE